MSAYIVNDNHIHALVTAALETNNYGPLRWFAPETEEPAGEADYEAGQPWGPTAIETANRRGRTLTHANASEVGLMLLAQNYASVNFRYAEKDDDFPMYRFRELPGIPSRHPVTVLKALDGYEYQACETPDWEETEAHAFCQALRKRMIHKLPGYDDAPWSIDEPNVFGNEISLMSLVRENQARKRK